MPKIITINTLKILEINISQQEEDYTAMVRYALLDANDKEWDSKNITIKDFKANNKDFKKIFKTLEDKIKIIEEL